MFNHSLVLKENKSGDFQNSTQTCRILADRSNKMRFSEAWSYGQKLAIICHAKKAIFYNSTRFSQTTSKHFHYIRNKIESRHKTYKTFFLEIDSLNGYSEKSIKVLLDDTKLNYTESLGQAVKLGYLKGKNKLALILEKTQEIENQDRLDRKFCSLRSKVFSLNYKTLKGLTRAMNTLNENNRPLCTETSLENLFRYREFTKENKICVKDAMRHIISLWRRYNESQREILKTLIDFFEVRGEYYDLPLHEYLESEYLSEENLPFLLYLDSRNLLAKNDKITSEIINKAKTCQVFSDLGD